MTQQNSSIDISTEDIPQSIPILPLFDTALFPKMVLPLVVLQNESIQLVDEAMAKNRIIGLLFSKKNTKDAIQLALENIVQAVTIGKKLIYDGCDVLKDDDVLTKV